MVYCLKMHGRPPSSKQLYSSAASVVYKKQTDGFGRSDTREALRRFFEVDTGHVVVSVLHALSQDGTIDASLVAEAIAHKGRDVDSADPGRHDTVPATGHSGGREDYPD